jgi:hypothetical protein
LKAFVVLTLLLSSPVAAASPCNDYGFGIVFKDTLYGAATGAVLSGLAVWAAGDHDETDRKVAIGALGAGVLGGAYGVFEATTRTCVDKGGASLTPLPTKDGLGASFNVRFALN